MKRNQIFDKFKSKLTLEAVLKSFLTGLSVGLAVCGVIALICWLSGYKDGIWVALGVGGGVGIISMPLFYLMFRPSEMQTGRRVDETGLQERAVTMLDYMEDDSYIASRQREDAQSHIVATNPKSMKTVIPVWIVIVLISAFVFCIPFSVVGGLYRFEVIQSPTAPIDPLAQFVAVSYIVEDGGEIVGETDQLLLPGEDATTVTAIAMDGYVFTGWDDGNKNPERTDLKITEDLEVTALFDPIDEGSDSEQGDVDGPGNEGDSATDQPSDGEGQGQGGEGDGSGNKGDSEGSGSGDEKGEGKGDGQGEGAGGQWSEGNRIIDGEIFYRDYLKQYYADAMQQLTSLDDLPPEIRAFIESYYESV